jgi:hypothetical protein
MIRFRNHTVDCGNSFPTARYLRFLLGGLCHGSPATSGAVASRVGAAAALGAGPAAQPAIARRLDPLGGRRGGPVGHVRPSGIRRLGSGAGRGLEVGSERSALDCRLRLGLVGGRAVGGGAWWLAGSPDLGHGSWDDGDGIRPVEFLSEKLDLAVQYRRPGFFRSPGSTRGSSASERRGYRDRSLRMAERDPVRTLADLTVRLESPPPPPDGPDDQDAFERCSKYYRNQPRGEPAATRVLLDPPAADDHPAVPSPDSCAIRKLPADAHGHDCQRQSRAGAAGCTIAWTYGAACCCTRRTRIRVRTRPGGWRWFGSCWRPMDESACRPRLRIRDAGTGDSRCRPWFRARSAAELAGTGPDAGHQMDDADRRPAMPAGSWRLYVKNDTLSTPDNRPGPGSEQLVCWKGE